MASTQVGSRGNSCLLRFFLGALIVFVLLTAVAFVLETVAASAAIRNHPPPGDLVDVGGYRMHLHVMGEDQGQPAVILDAGGGGFSPLWGWVMEEIAEHTLVVAYDRPNMGWSDNTPQLLDARQAVDDLHSGLQQVGVEGPYILVGHSMGGLMNRVFASAYPQDVAGMVLVDPRDTTWEGIYAPGEADLSPAVYTIIKAASRLGVIRLTGYAEREAEGLPPRQYEQLTAIGPSYQHMSGLGSEEVLGNTASTYVDQNEDLSDMPLIVLSAAEPDEAFDPQQREALNRLHARIADQSEFGEQRSVEGAGHITIVTHQQYAAEVAAAIMDMLESQR
jgi:pimeloyl-ACP methyl ester carboxylesterase